LGSGRQDSHADAPQNQHRNAQLQQRTAPNPVTNGPKQQAADRTHQTNLCKHTKGSHELHFCRVSGKGLGLYCALKTTKQGDVKPLNSVANRSRKFGPMLPYKRDPGRPDLLM
jgi:hypothetical protein